MSHLTTEELARLIDEPPDPLDAKHLDQCATCAAELATLREQRDTLASLGPIAPPAGAWEAIERRLFTEGLLGAPRRSGGWLQAAAAVALLLAGGALGALLQARGGTPAAMDEATTAAATTSPEAAAEALEIAESRYLAALARYNELVQESTDPELDPYTRLAALEGIVLTTRAALNEAPADPVINGYHLTALAQRDATLRHLASNTGQTLF